MRILHVEDDPDTRTLVSLVLQAEGWEVVSVADSSAGLVHAVSSDFDLFLLDNWMEGDSGNALCTKLHSIFPGTPILFLSGAVYPTDIKGALASGAVGYLEKPSTPEALVSEIKRLANK